MNTQEPEREITTADLLVHLRYADGTLIPDGACERPFKLNRATAVAEWRQLAA